MKRFFAMAALALVVRVEGTPQRVTLCEAAGANESSAHTAAVPLQNADRVRVDIPTGDVREVLRTVADAAGLSIFIPGELAGTVSLRADGVPYGEVFDALLRPRGYGWRLTPGGLVVVERAAYPGGVVRMRNRSASEVEDLLAKVVRKDEGVQAVGDDVLIDADAQRTAYLAQRVQGLDRPLRQVLVECRFQEVSSQASRSLGINWSSLGSYSVAVRPKAVDIGSGHAMGAVLSASELAVVLAALDASAGTRVVSRPTVIASEGKQAQVAIGQQYPLPQYSFSQQQGVLQVLGFQFKDIGILLKVTPRFAGDRVVLELEPEVSSVASTTTFGGAGAATLPVIATRRVNTQVELGDGDTIAISGLISSEITDNRAEVRGLGRVPVLGALFRSHGTGRNTGELVVFVTVRVVRSTVDTADAEAP